MSGIPQIVGRACLEISSVTPAMLVRRPLPSGARHEAKLCVVQTARTSRSEALVSDHCSTKETTLSGIGASTKRPLVSGAPNPPPAPTKPKTTKRAHYENNRSRRAEPRQWTPAEGSRSCGDPRCARPPSTPSTVEWPTFFSGRRCGKPSAMSHGHSWAQFFERRAGAGWRCVADTGGNPPPLASHGSESSSWRTATGLAGFQTKSHGSMLRLPSDLVALCTDSLVGCGRSTQYRWALLLYPAEFKERSRMWQRYGFTFLASQRASRPPGQGLWSFSWAHLSRSLPESCRRS